MMSETKYHDGTQRVTSVLLPFRSTVHLFLLMKACTLALLLKASEGDAQSEFPDEAPCDRSWMYDRSRNMCYHKAERSLESDEAKNLCSRLNSHLLSFDRMSDWTSLMDLEQANWTDLQTDVARFWLDLRLNSQNGTLHFNGTSFRPSVEELPTTDEVLKRIYTGKNSTDGWMCFIVAFRDHRPNSWKLRHCRSSKRGVLCQRPANTTNLPTSSLLLTKTTTSANTTNLPTSSLPLTKTTTSANTTNLPTSSLLLTKTTTSAATTTNLLTSSLPLTKTTLSAMETTSAGTNLSLTATSGISQTPTADQRSATPALLTTRAGVQQITLVSTISSAMSPEPNMTDNVSNDSASSPFSPAVTVTLTQTVPERTPADKEEKSGLSSRDLTLIYVGGGMSSFLILAVTVAFFVQHKRKKRRRRAAAARVAIAGGLWIPEAPANTDHNNDKWQTVQAPVLNKVEEIAV